MPTAGPSLGRVLASAGLIGGVPVVLFAGLGATGALAPAPALACGAASALSALVLARIWIGNLRHLSAAMRHAAEEGGGELPPLQAPVLLPSVQELEQGIRRLARSLAERGELVGRLRRADAAIVENLPDPLLVLTADRTPLRANRAARMLFGVAGGGAGAAAPSAGATAAPPSRDAGAGALGADVAALLRHPALATAADRALAVAGEDRSAPQAADLTLPVPVMRDLVAQVIPMEPPLSDGGRLVVVLSDRTRERAVERMRADFVANASHELRTPLASLIGFIETLRGPAEDDPAARARFLSIMAEQADRMRRLIDDLLGLSRIELVEHQPPTGRVDLAALARTEVEAMAPILAKRRVRLETALETGTMAEPADGEQVAQVLRNLLENAVRYGRDGGTIQLTVARATPGEVAPGWPAAGAGVGAGATTRLPGRPGVVLAVSDDGPGIPREHIPRLTERFYRVDKGRSRGAGGTGLGLAIVKHIVNRHRGLLLIDSEEGMGTTFRVWLPASG